MKSTQNTWFRVNRDCSNNSPSSTSVLMISLFWVVGISQRITSVDGFKPCKTWRLKSYGMCSRFQKTF